jgi:hypothetical protein
VIRKAWGFVLSCLTLLIIAILALQKGWVNEYRLAYAVVAFILLYFLISFKDLYQHLRRHGPAWDRLFSLLRVKLWMTFGLALFFGALFLAFNVVTKELLSKEVLIQNFLALLEQPQKLLLWGCTIFVFNAVLIILVRRVIQLLCTKDYS